MRSVRGLRYNNSRCFETFPFPPLDHPAIARLRKLGEDLDAHRRRALADHPAFKLTDVYNVLARVRAGEPLGEKERATYDAALVGILRDLHDAIDRAMLEAYGFPADIDDDALLERLADLNRARREEEKRGTVRWLREPIQNAGAMAARLPVDAHEQDDATPDDEVTSAAAGKPGWPKALPDQLSAVRAEIRSLPAPFGTGDVAARFAGANRADVGAALDCLAALGFVLRLGAGDRGDELFGSVG